jgi:uncharacterized membrane protein
MAAMETRALRHGARVISLGLAAAIGSTACDEDALSSRPRPLDDGQAAHEPEENIGTTAHGFVGASSSGPFSTIDARDATFYTAVFGIDSDGRTVGGYVDTMGRVRGFLRTGDELTPIDVPGARHTFASRINARGQIVGGYSSERFSPAMELTHGFLLDDGEFTTIEVPGAVRTQPFGINKHGHVVGEYVDADGKTHGFLLDQDGVTTIDAPGGTATLAFDIDDSGRVVGFSLDATGLFHGFSRDAQGAFTQIDDPDAARGTLPFGTNNRGQIVGVSLQLVEERLEGRPFVLEDSTFTTVDVPDATVGALPFDINDDGQIAGVYDLVQHAFLRERDGEFRAIDPLEGTVNEQVAINKRGQIVGRYADGEGNNRGFLQFEGDFTSIDVPGAIATATFGINDDGQIVGNYSTVSNNTGYPVHGYLLDGDDFTEFDFPDAQHTSALSINNSDEIVGEYQDAAGGLHSYRRDASGDFTTIDIPDAMRTLAVSINDGGQVVGQYIAADGSIHGFLMDQGDVTDIDGPEGTIAAPFSINNRGEIVGSLFDGLRFRGFYLKDGVFERITPPGNFFPYVLGTFVTDIDDSGRIVGAAL